MSRLEANGGRVRVEKYSNERMRARQARILSEARALIGSKGIQGLTMRELAKKSDVAFRTLYNIYGSKDVLVSYAVKDFLENIIVISVRKSRNKPHLERLLALLDMIANEVIKASAYVHVLISTYFKFDRPQEIHDLLHQIVLSTFADFLHELKVMGALKEWTSVDLLAEEIAEKVMWRIFQWTHQHISDAELSDYLKFSVLQLLSGSVLDQLEVEVDKQQKKLVRKLAKAMLARTV